jgi:hypothetical protein
MTLVPLRPTDPYNAPLAVQRSEGFRRHTSYCSEPIKDSYCGLPEGSQVPCPIFSSGRAVFCPGRRC